MKRLDRIRVLGVISVVILAACSGYVGAEEKTPKAVEAKKEAAPAAAEKPLMADELLKKMAPHLIDSTGKQRSVDLGAKEYVLVYWSASWCGPCHKFTPMLEKYYRENNGGDKFEVVLVCIDRSEEKMMAYMKKYKMPWPAVTFSEKRGTGAKAFAKGGIPRLMIINRKGEVIDRGNAFTMFRKFKALIAPESTS